MITIILIFAALTLIAGVLMVINPEWIFGPLRKVVDKPAIHLTAVLTRLVLGYLLIQVADASKYPLIIEALGWLALVAAALLAVMGRENFKRLMTWALNLVKTLGRVAGVFAALFAAFLIHALT
jgi:hypothetical protein